MPNCRIAAGLPAALLLLALAVPATAAEAPKPAAARAKRASAAKPAPAANSVPAAAPAPAKPLPPAAAGMVVGIDPETGVLGPATAAQMLELFPEEANALSRSTEGLVPRALPGGGVLLDLGGRFQEFSYVRMTPDGRYVFGCASDLAVVRRALGEQAKQPAALEER